jgi:hypothetical protein
MILYIFSSKTLEKKLSFLSNYLHTASFSKNLIIALVFEKNAANFFAENCRKSQKIVIIASTPALVRHLVISLLRKQCSENKKGSEQ